jgi:hypothetical protein
MTRAAARESPKIGLGCLGGYLVVGCVAAFGRFPGTLTGCKMDREFLEAPEFSDQNSPTIEELIINFRSRVCSLSCYHSRGNENGNLIIDTSVFTEPFDTFLRSITAFRPARQHFLANGPHAYVRGYMEGFIFERHIDAISGAYIADEMLSKTYAMMASIEHFIAFAKSDTVSQSIASRLPVSRFWETDLERGARWKSYWKNLEIIEASFWSVIAIHEIAKEKREVSRVRIGPGPEKTYWKHDFVNWIAHLLFNLFSTIPSSSPDSQFAEFLESVWASIDPENLHPQNWDRTIRDVVRELKVSKSKT